MNKLRTLRSFNTFLNENVNNRLDISIKNADKVKPETVINSNWIVEEKTDGTKLSIIKFDDGIYVAYKNTLIFQEEFDEITLRAAKGSMGSSQYKFVWDKIQKRLDKIKSIPGNWEFFCEFLMDKPTLTRDYYKKHDIILLAKSKISRMETTGISVKTNPTEFNTDVNKEAKVFGFHRPAIFFKGSFKTLSDIQSGIVDDRLNEIYIPANYDIMTIEQKYTLVKNLFLRLESVYGGKTEGVVLKSTDSDTYLKFLQDDQHDKAIRAIKRDSQRMSPEEETLYWKNVRADVFDIIEGLSGTLPEKLKSLNRYITQIKEDDLPLHQKKSLQTIRDDMALTGKLILNRREPGNNNALVLGKFRVLTSNGHVKMIDEALAEHDSVVITLVSSKDTKGTKDLRRRMLEAVYPNLEIIETTSGNLSTILNKSPKNINAIYAGTDRVDSYEKQLQRNPDVKVKEIQRSDSDVSATRVIKMIKDNRRDLFENNTPLEIHQFWDELRETYA